MRCVPGYNLLSDHSHIRLVGPFLEQVCPSTLAPVTAPTPTPPTQSPGGTCFSGATTVFVKGVGAIPMSQIQVGDEVQVSEAKEFDVVYSLGKKDKLTESEFIQIIVERQDTPLELTPHHLVLVNSQWKQASKIVIGDIVSTDSGPSLVQSVTSIRSKGFYAPFTYSGVIMASGVKASVFAGPETLQFGMNHDWDTGVPLHDVLQLSLSHHRVLCRLWFESCRAETHTEDGVSHLLDGPNKLYQWWTNQHGILGSIVLIPVMAMSWMAHQMEHLLT